MYVQKKKQTRIFALMLDKKVFVGRSAAIKLSAVVYSHCRGEHWQTRLHFDLAEKRPELYVLEEVNDVSPVTYRYWLAWVHAFDVEGYELLNREDVLEDSRDLHPETRRIYEEIQRIPFELQLEFALCPTYSTYDFNTEDPKPYEAPAPREKCFATASEKLSIRLSKLEKETIVAFADSMNLSIRDALQYAINRVMLCDEIALRADREMYSLHERYKQDVQNLREKNTELIEKAKQQRIESAEKLEKHRKHMEAIQAGIQKHLTYFEPDATIPMCIEQGIYRKYMRNTQIDYQYPQEEGFSVIRPHAILWGSSHQVRFLVGEIDQGDNIKLRYYPGKSFTGMFPANDQFGLRGSCWLVGWEQKEGDVMQLHFALPLSVRQKYDNPMTVKNEWGRLMREIDKDN